MPCPRLKMNRPSWKSRHDRIDRAIKRVTTGKQRQRIEISLHCDPALHPLANKLSIRHPVDAHRVDRNAINIVSQQMTGAARKSDHARVRYLSPKFVHDPRRGLDAPAREFLGRQHAGPGVEQLHRIDARFELLARDNSPNSRQAGRQASQKPSAVRTQTSAPAPDRSCLDPRSCRSPPSRARRKIR